VRLERRLQLCRCLELDLDIHLCRGERRLGVAARLLRGLGGEALLAECLVRVDHVGKRLDLRRQRDERGEGLLERVGGAAAIGWPA
jgi:hypothetical protein